MVNSAIANAFGLRAAIGVFLFGATGAAIALPAQAQVTAPADQLSIALSLLPGESYDAFIERAETAAEQQVRSYFQRTSDDSILVTVTANNAGLIAPVFEMDVTRQQWSAAPRAERWATYFLSSDVLLGLTQPPAQPSPAAVDGDTVVQDADAQDSGPSSTTVTITAPASDADSITPTDAGDTASDRDDVVDNDVIEGGDIQPQTSITTPDSDVAPLDVEPNAGTTDSDDIVDFEDTNDVEFIPDDSPAELTDEAGAIESAPETTESAADVAPFEVAPDADDLSDGTFIQESDVDVIEAPNERMHGAHRLGSSG